MMHHRLVYPTKVCVLANNSRIHHLVFGLAHYRWYLFHIFVLQSLSQKFIPFHCFTTHLFIILIFATIAYNIVSTDAFIKHKRVNVP